MLLRSFFPSKPSIFSSTFQFPEIMLNIITVSVSDSLAMCPEYKVVTYRIRKAKKAHLRETGEVGMNVS
jgi:hypothetical protein